MERTSIPRGRYSKEFREEAVRLVTEGGLSAGEASARLSLPKSTLENWARAAKRGKLGEIGKSHRPLTELEDESSVVEAPQLFKPSCPGVLMLLDRLHDMGDERSI